jgi:hypothetical protein
VIVRFRTEAADDVTLAWEWYDAQRAGLGDSFLNSLESAVDLITAVRLHEDSPLVGTTR